MTDKPKTQNQVLSWAAARPTLALIAVLFLFIVVIEILFPPPVGGSTFLIFMYFAPGAYTIVSVVRGFISIFSPQFKKSPSATRRRILLLSFVLLLPCFGIAAFFATAIVEFITALSCGLCGGIPTILFMYVAWVSYFVTRGLSSLMMKLRWWPDGITPKF
ncbi:MAG: hypothetical protein WC073_12000 [Sterolibacterium sp.]